LTDIVFVLDITGSMEDEINAVKNNMISFINALKTSDIDFRIGIVEYADDNFVFNNGNLYSDVNTINSTINSIYLGEHGLGNGDEWPEDGFDALKAAMLLNFRPGSQRVFIMLTDAPCHFEGDESIYSEESDGNVTDYTRDLIIEELKENKVTVYCVAANIGTNTYGNDLYNYQYEGPGSISEETNGRWFDIYSNFNDIILDIEEMISNQYVIRYKTSKPICDGVERTVQVVVYYNVNTVTAEDSYIPCSMPIIERTTATKDLHDRAWAQGTQFTIEVEITDDVSPYVLSATLYYKNTSATSYHSTTMYNSGGDIWQGTINGSNVQTPGLDYYITATDGVNTASDPSVDSKTAPYQIAILPNEAPQITHTQVVTLTAGFPITITADVIDNTNSLVGVKLYYRKTGQLIYQSVDMGNMTGDNYKAQIPSNYVTNDGIDYYLRAWDDFGVSGYSGTADKPYQIEADYDLGFRPNPDGWQFGNSQQNMWPQSWWNQFDYSQDPYPFAWRSICRPQDFPDWPIFVEAFGDGLCYWDPPPGIIIYSPSAVLRWLGLKGNWGGSCFGFAISSFLTFDDKTAFTNVFSNLGSFNKLYDLVINDERRKCINQLWIYQFGKDQQAHINANSSNRPIQTLNEIKQMFRNNIRDDRILVFFNQNGSGGHAVNPYKIEKDSDNPNLVYIYVYDNNWPNNANRRITINTNNTWSYFASTNAQGQPVDWGGREGLFLMDPVSNYLISPGLPKKIPPKERWISGTSNGTNYVEFYNTTNASIVIKDQSVNTIGYADSLAFNNFEDGIPIIPITGGFHPPIGYYIPEGEYSIRMRDFSDSFSYFSVFTDSTVYSYSRSDADSSQKDYLSYGNGFALGNQDDQSNNISLETIIIEDDNEKVFSMENCKLFKNDSLRFIIANRRDFKITNLGSNMSYDINVQLVAANTNIIFEHKKLSLSSNSAHRVSPSWENLENEPISIYIDNNLDGISDDTLYVKNQYVGDTPSTGGKLTNENIYYYPNPFNPNEEMGQIRYSLHESGNVTVKIYDVSNTLVRTIIEDAPRDAGVDLAEQWNGKNENWDIVANGVYFYVIESSTGEKAVGKIAVLR